MPLPIDKPRLFLIIGPTAVGKTELSLQVAQKLNGEIVSIDSRLLYRGMDIGTAKPTRAERQTVPHHLIDVTDPDQPWSLAIFQAAAKEAIADIHSRQRYPILVGGTGQYVRAVVDGWDLPRVEPNPDMRIVLEHWAREIGNQGLHDRLAVLDPVAASQIDARNLRRVIRGLEVIFSSGQLFSSQRKQVDSPYAVMKIGLERSRDELYNRIDSRIDTMLKTGLVEEVKELLRKGYSIDLPAFSAIGYCQIIDYLAGKTSLDEAVMQIKKQSRIFVRRQTNWFHKDDKTINWYRADNSLVTRVLSDISLWVEDGLKQ
jgi:tRNA dimethylallyltransferase